MTKKMQYDEFVEKAKSVHGDLYTYLPDTFNGVGSKTTIVCSVHGPFLQKVGNHIYCKQGCPKCGVSRRSQNSMKTTATFIADAKQRHGDFYDYSQFQYTGANKKGTIICPQHGVFEQSPDVHVNFGCGCPQCGYERTLSASKLTDDEIMTRLVENFGSDYDLTLVVSRTQHFPLPLGCPKHGKFFMSYENFRLGQGCPYCAKRFGEKQNLWLDTLGVSRELWQKRVHLTDGSFIIADAYDPSTKTIYEFWGDYHHGHPDVYPPETIHYLSKKTLGELYAKTVEKIEKIKQSGFNLIEIWEHEWDKSH